DDVFQAIGLDKAELLVKQFLNMIEYPSVKYEKIVIVVASSEGVTRRKVGRHSWALIRAMWNMPKEGFRQLYDLLPGEKPPFDEVWRWTGGNPRYLELLHKVGWDAEKVVKVLAAERGVGDLVGGLPEGREVLRRALDDPDVLLEEMRRAETLVNKLIELNLVARITEYREEYLWVDAPPPERDPELGVGKYYAWQTPLHREAVRRALMG
ncbi:MAG: ATP-binding protein, partial [Thermoproteus sp.]